jgi:serine/threonine-protein kinase
MGARHVLAAVSDERRTQTADDAAPPPAASHRAPGTVVAGKYRIERVLGEGGMGVVYRARHLALDEPIALKLLSSELAKHPEAVARFLREARACARLRSKHVVTVHDAGTLDEGTPYVAMELLEGSDLGDLLRDRGPLPVVDAVDYVLQACEGLSAAHALGIVHRDIKPSNLWLVAEQRLIKVLDFGIAKMGSTEAREDYTDTLTASTTVLGSPAYMSPEQIRRASNVDARADIWALGVVLFELLTGKFPFRGTSASALLAAISADPPGRPRRLRPDIPARLQAVILSCLERDPDRRPRDIAELVRRLTPFRTPATEKTPISAAVVFGAATAGIGAIIALVVSSLGSEPLRHAERAALSPARSIRSVERSVWPARAVAPAVEPSAGPSPARIARQPTKSTAEPGRDAFADSVEAATAHRK